MEVDITNGLRKEIKLTTTENFQFIKRTNSCKSTVTYQIKSY
jgi:hypothetical protein